MVGQIELVYQFDFVIVVSATQDVIIERLKKRDRLSEEEINKRIDSQMPLAIKEKRADYIIRNNSSINALKSQVNKLIIWLQEKKSN